MKKREKRISPQRQKNTSSFSLPSPLGILANVSPETQRGLFVVFLFACAVLLGLSLFGKAGSVGNWISQGFALAFGETKGVVPFAVFLFGFLMLRREAVVFHWISLVGFFLALFSLTALWHLRFLPEESLVFASLGLGGGFSGFLLAYPLLMVVGFWGGLVVLCALFLSSLLIILNTSLGGMLQGVNVWLGSLLSGLFSSMRSSSRRVVPSFAEKNEDSDESALFEKKDLAPRTFSLPFSKKKNEKEKSDEQFMQPQTGMEVLQFSKRKQQVHLSLDLLNNRQSSPTSGDIKNNKIIIEKTLEQFGILVEMGEVNVGPTVTQYTLKPSEGVKVASLMGLHNDLALALAAHPIRIEAPIPGRALVGIEVPNQKTALVTLRELLESEVFKKRKSNLSLVLGKDVSGVPRLADLRSMPHLLVAGSTGSGKTVCINTMIMGLLFQNTPDELRFIMIDPKRVELPCYNDIPHLLTPVIVDAKKTLNALRWGVGEMERRFETLSKHGKRDIASYNRDIKETLPYIVVIIDELADIMVTSGAEAESLIIRLAQMARAVGIHLILATQRPSVDVITGLIKANVTSRIAFAVASQMDSRTILDTSGAEKLLGKGDMLYTSADLSKPVRLQGGYVSDDEIERVVSSLKESGEPAYKTEVIERTVAQGENGGFGDNNDDDDLLSEAREVVMRAGKASASLLQRRLRVGYARAARMLDLLEAQGVIGPADGARPREVLVNNQDNGFDDESADEEKRSY